MKNLGNLAEIMRQQAAPFNAPRTAPNIQPNPFAQSNVQPNAQPNIQPFANPNQATPASQSAPNQAAQWEEPIPFEGLDLPTMDPVVLPEPFCSFCSCVSEFLQTPFELVAATALAVVSVAVQGKFEVKIREGYTEPLNTYWNVPLPPSEKKTPTQKLCKAPLVNHEIDVNAQELPELRRKQSERYTLERAIEHKRTAAAKAKDAEARNAFMDEIAELEDQLQEVSYLTRYLADDVTPEALASLMAQQKGKMAVIEAEATLFDISAGRYSSTPNFDILLKSYSVEPIRIDRKHTDAITLQNPHLTLCISPQPYVVQNRTTGSAFRGKGLDARFLYLLPKSRVGARTMDPTPIPKDIEHAYHAKIYSLLNIPQQYTEQGKLVAHELTLSPEAYTLWLTFAEEVEQGLRPHGDLSGIQDAAGKLCGNVARLAGLLHCAFYDRPQDHPICENTMYNACYLGDIIKEHTKAMYDLMGEDENTYMAKKVLQWIMDNEGKSFTARDCMVRFKGVLKNMGAVSTVLDILEDRFYLAKDFEAMSVPTGGRPSSTIYKVNPFVWGACSL